MVVPPVSTDLLKEHAIYEFGYRREFDLYDFDYTMAGEHTVHLHPSCLVRNMLFCVLALSVVWLLLSWLAPLIRKQPKRLNDLEAMPELSYSATPTPGGSPMMTRDMHFDTFVFGDVKRA